MKPCMKVSSSISVVSSWQSSRPMTSITSHSASPAESTPWRSISYCVTGPHFHRMFVCLRSRKRNIDLSPSCAASWIGVQWLSLSAVSRPSATARPAVASCAGASVGSPGLPTPVVSQLYMSFRPLAQTAWIGRKPVMSHRAAGALSETSSVVSIAATARLRQKQHAYPSGVPP